MGLSKLTARADNSSGKSLGKSSVKSKPYIGIRQYSQASSRKQKGAMSLWLGVFLAISAGTAGWLYFDGQSKSAQFNREVSDQRNEISRLENRLRQQQTRIDEANQTDSQLRDQNKSLKAQIAELETQLESSNSATASAEKAVAEKDQRLQAVNEEFCPENTVGGDPRPTNRSPRTTSPSQPSVGYQPGKSHGQGNGSDPNGRTFVG